MSIEDFKNIERRLESLKAIGTAFIVIGVATLIVDLCSLPDLSVVDLAVRKPYWANPFLVDFWASAVCGLIGICFVIVASFLSRSIPEKTESPWRFPTIVGVYAALNSVAMIVLDIVYIETASFPLEFAIGLTYSNILHIITLFLGLGTALYCGFQY
jgi:hypothetical protein